MTAPSEPGDDRPDPSLGAIMSERRQLINLAYGVTGAVMAFEVGGDRITRIWAVRNPEKLRPWTRGKERDQGYAVAHRPFSAVTKNR